MRRALHLVPGVNEDAPRELLDEHSVAVSSIATALKKASRPGWEITAHLIRAPSWPDRAPFPLFDQAIETLENRANWSGGRFPPLLDYLTDLDVTNFDIIIFSNSDIGLVHDAYERILELWERHRASLTIHRRTLTAEVVSPMTSDYLVKNSSSHSGSDFFVFEPRVFIELRRALVPTAVLGLPPIGSIINALLGGLSPSFVRLADESLTFHIRDDRRWNSTSLSRLKRKNFLSACAVFFQILIRFGPAAFIRALRAYGNGSSYRSVKRLFRGLTS